MDIPYELILHTATYCTGPEVLLLSSVCKLYQKLLLEDNLWYSLLIRDRHYHWAKPLELQCSVYGCKWLEVYQKVITEDLHVFHIAVCGSPRSGKKTWIERVVTGECIREYYLTTQYTKQAPEYLTDKGNVIVFLTYCPSKTILEEGYSAILSFGVESDHNSSIPVFVIDAMSTWTKYKHDICLNTHINHNIFVPIERCIEYYLGPIACLESYYP